MNKLGSPASSRASFYLYNQPEDVDILGETVREAIRFFR